MGQAQAIRFGYSAVHALTSATNDDYQTLDQTYFVKVGDILEFWDTDADGCLVSLIGTRGVTGICPDEAITLGSAIDLTAASGTVSVRNRTIDDVGAAVSRLYSNGFDPSDMLLSWSPEITDCELDEPAVGQSKQTSAGASCFYTGDSWAIISDEGLAGTGTVLNVEYATNQITIDDSIDCDALTNPKIINTSIDLKTQILRIKNQLDLITAPTTEELTDGDCGSTVFFASSAYAAGSTSLFLDGIRKRRGTLGTLAGLVNGAGNDELTITSVVTGVKGNTISFEMLDPAAASQPLSITVTGNYMDDNRKVSVSLATDGGSAITSTAQEVAEAINADSSARRLLRVIYGGDGSGVQSALVSTSLSGGLDDATGDYAELQVVSNNLLAGFQGVSINIFPDDIKRLNAPPTNTEELDLSYGLAV